MFGSSRRSDIGRDWGQWPRQDLGHSAIDGGVDMGNIDKVKNSAEEVGGKVKEAGGKATGNEDLENEGKLDQVKADVKQVGEKVKDVFKN